MQKHLKICVNSQTPVIRFKLTLDELMEKYGKIEDPVAPQNLEEGVDYDFSPGGVTAMVYPMLKRLLQTGRVSKAYWVSLGVNFPPRVLMDGIIVSHVEIETGALKRYTAYKERLWNELHGLGEGKFEELDYFAYVKYNTSNVEKLLELVGDVDLFDIQDFQQLLVGGLIGPSAPAVLRWHVPFSPESLSQKTHHFVIKAMEGFDAVVVSTRRDLEGLIRSSFRGVAYQIYPFVDPAEWNGLTKEAAQEFRDKVGLRPDEKLLSLVARMDRIKSQDVAIRALSRLKGKEKLRLALIGNGSFSSSERGGLSYGKAAGWKAELEELARQLGVAENVTFVGHATKRTLEAAYGISCAVLLTSSIEGFGITVLEGWLHRKPVVVSSGTGASELVVDGVNGYVFRAGDDAELAEKLLLCMGERGERMGNAGFESSKRCHLAESSERVAQVYEEVSSRFGASGGRHP